MGRIVGLKFEKAKPTQKPSKFDGMDVDQLKAYAEENRIDIGNSSSVKGITKKIEDAEKAKADAEAETKAEEE